MGLLTDNDIFNMILQESNNIYLYERREICAIDKLIKELKEECDYLDTFLGDIKNMWCLEDFKMTLDIDYYDKLRKYRNRELMELKERRMKILREFRRNFF